MGFIDYFRAQRPVPEINPAVQSSDPSIASAGGADDNLELRPSPNLSGSSSQISGTIEDIKHEVMVNYLYQQQCGHMWVSAVQSYKRTSTPFHSPKYPQTPNEDASQRALTGMELSADQEGVLLRKSKGNYIACPPDLIGTPLEMACRALNVSVRLFIQQNSLSFSSVMTKSKPNFLTFI